MEPTEEEPNQTQLAQSGRGEEHGDQEQLEDVNSNHSSNLDSHAVGTLQEDDQWRLSRLSQLDIELGFPSSYTTQLLRVTAQVAQKQEDEIIQRSWRAVRRSRVWNRSLMLASRAARVKPCLPLPHPIRNALHELQPVFLTFQLMTLIWFSTKLDLNAQLRGPLKDAQSYMTHRLPLLPEQGGLQSQLKCCLLWFSLVYLPSTFLHFNYVLDDLPDETPLQLVRKAILARETRQSMRRSRRWSFDPRFDQFKQPRRRQWASVAVFCLGGITALVLLTLLAGTCNGAIQSSKWSRSVSRWLEQLMDEYNEQQNITTDYHGLDRYVIGNSGNERAREPLTGRALVDRIQIMFQCCGLNSYNDWSERRSLIQPKEAIRQVTKAFVEMRLYLTFWHEMTKVTKAKARDISVMQKKTYDYGVAKNRLRAIAQRVLGGDTFAREAQLPSKLAAEPETHEADEPAKHGKQMPDRTSSSSPEYEDKSSSEWLGSIEQTESPTETRTVDTSNDYYDNDDDDDNITSRSRNGSDRSRIGRDSLKRGTV